MGIARLWRARVGAPLIKFVAGHRTYARMDVREQLLPAPDNAMLQVCTRAIWEDPAGGSSPSGSSQ